jgi:hypothetical protein
VNVSHEERTNPSKDQLDEVLELLAAANDAGQLVSLVYMLKDGDNAVVDYRGTQEHTELACRTVNGRIADDVERSHPHLAAAIRHDLQRRGH